MRNVRIRVKFEFIPHTLVPQFLQKLLLGFSFAPQFVQNSGAFFAPQFSQKRLPLRKGAPHCLQNATAPATFPIAAPVLPAICALSSAGTMYFLGSSFKIFATANSGDTKYHKGSSQNAYIKPMEPSSVMTRKSNSPNGVFASYSPAISSNSLNLKLFPLPVKSHSWQCCSATSNASLKLAAIFIFVLSCSKSFSHNQ